MGLTGIDWDHLTGAAGYWAALWARNMGATTRALRLLCRWAFDALHLDAIELMTVVGNVASERVAEKAGFELTGTVEARAASLIGVAGDNPDGLWRLVAAVADQLDAPTVAAVTEMAGCAPTAAAAALSLVGVSPELIADTIVARCDGDAPAASRILADCGVATATAPAPTAPPATGIDDGLRRRGRRVIDDWSALTTTPGGESPDQPRLRLVTADHVHRPTP